METNNKDYEITKYTKVNEFTNEEYEYYIVKGIVNDPKDLPSTKKGGVVYPQLKLCPYCGGYPKVVTKSKTIIKGMPNRNYYVQCVRCESRGSRFIIDDFNNDKIRTKLEAINAWNRRYKPLFSEYAETTN